jgi:hypothetical protein
MKVAVSVIILMFSAFAGYSQTKDSTASGKLVAPWWVQKFKLTGGLFVPVNSTKIQVGANGGADGTDIDFQKDLGFGATVSTFTASFQYRLSRRSRFNLSFFDMNRSSTHTLQKEIDFNDQTYPINASVNAYFNTAIYQFSYGYAIIEKPTYEVGVMIGAHTVGAKSGISLNGTSAGASVSNNFGFTAPLPDLGIWGGYAFSDRFAANLDFDYLSLTVDAINGRILSYNMIFTYKLIRQLDLSLAYSGLNFNVKTTKKDVTGDFKWGYNGPSLTASFSFGEKSWVNHQ